MNIFAKQVNTIDVHNKMDNTSVLGFFGQIKSVILSYSALVTALGNVWTAFINAVAAYDNAYAQTRKWMQTDELEVLDKTRDKAVRGFMNALKALVAEPNAEKAAAPLPSIPTHAPVAEAQTPTNPQTPRTNFKIDFSPRKITNHELHSKKAPGR